MVWLVLAAMLAPISSGVSRAQPAAQGVDLDALGGSWRVHTSTFSDQSCVIVGQLRITPSQTPGVPHCAMSLQQVCEAADFGPFTSEQSCALNVANQAVFLRAQMVSIDPPGLPYRPDSFNLRVVSTDELAGLHTSSPYYSRPLRVRITRDRDQVS